MNAIDEYLSQFDGEVRRRLDEVRKAIAEEIPDAVEGMSYAIPTFDLGGRHVIHFAGFQNHVGLYPTPHGITAFDAELAPYKKAKGSVQLPHSQPLPLDLIRRIARHRAEEERARPKKKR